MTNVVTPPAAVVDETVPPGLNVNVELALSATAVPDPASGTGHAAAPEVQKFTNVAVLVGSFWT